MIDLIIDEVTGGGVLFQIALALGLVMLILTVRDHFTFKISYRPHEDYKSSIISLGIFGTFLGIIVGLWNFDTNNIEDSVPYLLEGLKTAFLTSFFGMGLTTILGVLQKSREAKRDKNDTELLLQSVYQISENLRESRETNSQLQSIINLLSEKSQTSKRLESIQREQLEILNEILLKGEAIQSEWRELEEKRRELVESTEIDNSQRVDIDSATVDLEDVTLDDEVKIDSQKNSHSYEKPSFETKEIVELPEALEERVMMSYIQPSMVKIPKGSFMMGSEDGRDYEKPLHRVDIDYDFYVGRYPVTFDEYDKFCDDIGKKRPSDKGWGRGRQPVINISWSDADEFAKWLSQKSGKEYSLLSEAEWEYVAKAGSETKWSFGDSADDLEQYSWYSDNSGGRANSVGEKLPNSFGVYDVHGNVWEWCEDDWTEDYSNTPVDGSSYKSEDTNRKKVLRGGSWFNFPDYTRSVNRSSSELSTKNGTYGFRLKAKSR